MEDDTIVQYLLVRKDLKWPTGALIAQACHGEQPTHAHRVAAANSLGAASYLRCCVAL
jgi:peptidyl-tRNA hydrolase